MPVVSNREAWLTELAAKMHPIFNGLSLPKYRLTCGWPVGNALSRKRRVIGQCFTSKVSKGGYHEIFISPLIDSSLIVAGVVSHELVHACVGVEQGHKKKFIKVCRHIGLTNGKPREVMPGDRLNAKLDQIISKMGEYPHTAIEVPDKPVKPTMTTVKLECHTCGCRIAMSQRWYKQAGPPTCACGEEFTNLNGGE